MSARKKWRLKLYPSFTTAPATSKVDAYRQVETFRKLYATGTSRTHHVNVEVKETERLGWGLYEKHVFPEAIGWGEALLASLGDDSEDPA